MGYSDKYSDLHARHIREAFIKNVAQRWQWQESNLVELERRDSWNIINALQEHNTIVRQLTRCHRMNIGFALNHLKAGYQYDEDSKLIGRKLFSFLEKKPNKVEIISTRSTIQVIEKEVSILELSFAEGNMGWGLFLGNKKVETSTHHEAIKTSWSLIEILVWMVINGLYHKKLKIQIRSMSLTLNTSDIQLTLNQIDQFLARYFSVEDKSLETYRQRKTQVASLVIINLGVLLPASRDDGLVVMSERSDTLSYGAARENFIHTIDCISISSWGEIFFSKHHDIEGLFTCFIENINKSKGATIPGQMTFACYTQLRARSIILRIGNIYQTLLRCYAIEANEDPVRYILPSGQAYFMFQEVSGSLKYYKIDSQSQLLKELGKSQDEFCSVHFDHIVLETTPIPYLYTLNKSGAIQVFFTVTTDAIDLYVIDEKGALFHQHHIKTTLKRLLAAYSAFLETIINNRNFDHNLAIEYHEVFSNSAGVFSFTPLIIESVMTQDFLPIRVTGIEINQLQINYTIYCNDSEFSSINFGDQVFRKASEYVVQLRNNKEYYPVYITDIDVPWTILGFDSEKQFQTIRYLQYKQKIEHRLNLYFS